MTEMSININRYAELHKGIERARGKLQDTELSLSVDTAGSLALAAFLECADELARVVAAYADRIEADSRTIYQIGVEFMESDDAQAKAYANALGKTLEVR